MEKSMVLVPTLSLVVKSGKEPLRMTFYRAMALRFKVEDAGELFSRITPSHLLVMRLTLALIKVVFKLQPAGMKER